MGGGACYYVSLLLALWLFFLLLVVFGFEFGFGFGLSNSQTKLIVRQQYDERGGPNEALFKKKGHIMINMKRKISRY